jgi:FAD/FMN-containing dehydrogenase
MLRFAGDHELPISVRGSGHGVAGHAISDGAIMIDLSLMRAYRWIRQRDRRELRPG